MIRADGLSKTYGHRTVLRDLDLGVAAGECLVLIGPNGAGKTTLLRILATLTKPGEGRMHICDLDLRAQAIHVRRRIGYLGHDTLLYQDLSAQENLRFYGQMYEVADLDARITALLRRVDLLGQRHTPVRAYSRGQTQRLAIARALLHDPDVLLMDEPFTGLDQRATDMLDRVILDTCGIGRAVLLTTHDLEHGWQLVRQSDPAPTRARIAFLIGGQIRPCPPAQEASLDDLRRAYARQLNPAFEE